MGICHADESTMPSWWKHNTILMKAQCHAGIRLLDLWCHDGTILVWQRACLREVSRWHQLWWQWKIIKMVPAWYQLYQEIQCLQCKLLPAMYTAASNVHCCQQCTLLPAIYNAGMELRQRVQQLYNFIYGLIRTFRTLIQYVYKTKLGCFYVTAILGWGYGWAEAEVEQKSARLLASTSRGWSWVVSVSKIVHTLVSVSTIRSFPVLCSV